jgi:hypothetical protein
MEEEATAEADKKSVPLMEESVKQLPIGRKQTSKKIRREAIRRIS